MKPERRLLEIHYKTETHRGTIFGRLDESEMENIKNTEVPKIDWLINETKYVLANYARIRRYYGFRKSIINDPRLNGDLFVGLHVNVEPYKDYWGWGTTDIGSKAIKVYWFTPDVSYAYISEKLPFFEASPAVTLVHEIEHTLGSDKEFIIPLAEAVGLKFYMTFSEYAPEKWINLELDSAIFRARLSIRKNRDKYAIDVVKAIYDSYPDRLMEIIRKSVPEEEQKALIEELEKKHESKKDKGKSALPVLIAALLLTKAFKE